VTETCAAVNDGINTWLEAVVLLGSLLLLLSFMLLVVSALLSALFSDKEASDA
jgi:hypothetical protein